MKDVNKLLETKILLSTENIHVFLLDYNLYNYDAFFSYLSEEEIERANKLKIEEKKKQFIITRSLLRKLLSNALNKSATEINFSYGENKKPYIEEKYNNKSVEFNISHSCNYGLIAITLETSIGVDIEKINQEIDFESLSNRFFSEKEKLELNHLDDNKKIDAFYRGWVRKESFIKAIGKGIAFGLDRFSVSLNENKFSTVDVELASAEEWYCYDLMEIKNYKTALVSNKPGNNKKQNIIFSQ